jgi:hypothetical protein
VGQGFNSSPDPLPLSYASRYASWVSAAGTWHLIRNNMVAAVCTVILLEKELLPLNYTCPKHSLKNSSLGPQTVLYTSWVTVAFTQNKFEPPSYAPSLSVATVATDNLTLHHLVLYSTPLANTVGTFLLNLSVNVSTFSVMYKTVPAAVTYWNFLLLLCAPIHNCLQMTDISDIMARHVLMFREILWAFHNSWTCELTGSTVKAFGCTLQTRCRPHIW